MKLKITLIICLTALFGYQVQAQCTGAQFQEINGIAVIEAESRDGSGWSQESSSSGFTGNGYNAYRGTNFFGSPGNNIVSYTVRINTPGTYRFQWRNRIGVIASSNASTEHNDSWLKFPDASDFYGQRGNSRIYPGGSGKSPNPEGASSGGWFKIYTNTINWSWSTQTSDFDPHQVFAVFNSPGVYTIQVSGRSNGHFIDRMVLHRTTISASSAQDLSRSQTNCDSSGPPPPPPPPPPTGGDNEDPSVSITSPSNGQNFTAGSTVTVRLSASDSDGTIAKHEIFVNGALRDTDGANYSAFSISNIAAGSYSIRARVTDNDGATDEATVNITVGSGGPPPPPPPPPPSGDDDPTVSITSPTNGQNFNTGSSVTVNLSANDPDGSVVRHQIYVNGALVDTDGSNYTPHRISNIAAGNYAIRALVTDNDGNTGEATVNITVGNGNPPPPPPPSGNNPPTVSITNPGNGQNFAPGSNVSVSLSANDSDGSVVKHQIFVNNVLVDTDGTNFTPHPINNISSGSYAIRATVTDNDGATASATVNITVGDNNPPPPPPPSGGDIGFVLINANTNSEVSTLSNGSNITAPNDKNIRVTSTLAGTSSVYFRLSGRLSRVWTENAAPYALYGDNNGNYTAVDFPSGSYSLTAEVWSGANRTGNKLGEATISFTVGVGTSKSAVGEVYVFPNPIKNGRFSVKVPEAVVGEVFYSLISTSGAEVETGKISINRVGENAEFNLDSFDNKNNGVYYLILQSKGSSYTVPLVKQ